VTIYKVGDKLQQQMRLQSSVNEDTHLDLHDLANAKLCVLRALKDALDNPTQSAYFARKPHYSCQ
jgi:hypothetical protein